MVLLQFPGLNGASAKFPAAAAATFGLEGACKTIRKLNELSCLASNLSGHHASDVGMRPFAFGPRIHVFQVVRQIQRIQFVMHEFSNVPGQIVVPVRIRGKVTRLGLHPFFVLLAFLASEKQDINF